MNVTFIITSLNFGGAERVISLLANRFSQDHNVNIITLNNDTPKYYLNDKIKLHQIQPSSSKFLTPLYSNVTYILKIRKALKKTKTDVVISFMPTSNVLSIISSFFSGRKVIISERANPEHNPINVFWKSLRFLTYKFCDFLVVQSELVKRNFVKNVSEDKIQIIYNPIEIIKKKSFKKEKIILTVGRLDNNKNQKQIIKSFVEVYKKNKDWRLIVCGDGYNMYKLKEQVKRFDIEDKVEFTGNVKNVSDYYSKASIFAFSSLSEGFPNVLLEAYNYKCACISFDSPSGPSNIIINNKTGFLVNLGDSEEYTRKMLELLSDNELISEFGNRGYESIDKFSLDNIYYQWLHLIDGNG